MKDTSQARLVAVDEYIERAAPFARPILQHLREVIHQGAPGVVESIKWSRPFFVYQGVILGNIAAFKEHCSFGLWGEQIAEALHEDGDTGRSGMGTFGKIATVNDLPSRKQLIAYVKLAATAIDEGARTKAWSRPKVVKPAVEVPDTLAAALQMAGLTSKFAAMTPGYRREYCQWIAEAKQKGTREKRAETAVEWIAEGKSRNWRYERKSD